MAGSSHPIVARIAIGLPEVVKLTTLSKKQKASIISLLFHMSQDLLVAYKRASIVLKDIQNIETNLAAQQTNPNVVSPALESAQSLYHAQDFLNYSRKAMRKLAKVMGIIFNKKSWNEPTFSTFLEALTKELPSDTSLLKILELYEPWCDFLRKLRNDDEHGDPEESSITNYTLKVKGGDCYLQRPQFAHKNTPVDEFLQASLKYLFPFCEEVVLFSLLEHLPEILEVIEISEQNRNIQCPKRFKVVPVGMT